MLLEKPLHRIGMRGHSIDDPIPKGLEVGFLEIFRTTIRSIAAGQIDPPKIIVMDGDLRQH